MLRAAAPCAARLLVAVLSGLCSACTGPEAPERVDLAIRNVLLVDGTGAPARLATLLVDDGRVVRVLAGTEHRAGIARRLVEGNGRTVIPGLWDMHVHLAGAEPHPEALGELIRYGVTTVRDLGGQLEVIDTFRRAIAAGTRTGPMIFRAGPTLNGVQPADFHRVVVDAAEASAAVADLARAGVDQIKIHREFPVDAFDELIRSARAHDLQVVGHVPWGISPIDACRRGMAGMEHLSAVMEAATKRPEAPAVGIAGSLAEFLGPPGLELAACLAGRGVMVTPQLSGYTYWMETMDDAKRRELTGNLRDRMTEIVGILHANRVPLLAGTDAPGPLGEIPWGESLHHDLEMLVQSGLTPLEAIRAASHLPATFLGVSDDTGSLQVGRRADLVILGADPLESIHNTRSIEMVFQGGRVVFEAAQRP